jgi:hypothetical protein
MDEVLYNKLLKAANGIVNNYRNKLNKSATCDLTLTAEDLIADIFITLSERGEEMTHDSFKAEIYKSLSKGQTQYRKDIHYDKIYTDIKRLKQWQQDNPEKVKEYSKIHSKELSKRANLWNKENREKCRKNHKNWRKENKERIKEYYYKRSKQSTIDQVNRFKAKNPNRWLEIQTKSKKDMVQNLRDSYVRGIIKSENKKNGNLSKEITKDEIEKRRQKIIERRLNKK